MKDPRMQRTAYLVAHAYTDPNGKMLPQIHAVRIYSESATSLSLCPRNTAALGVYEVRADDYQKARDLLCHTVQTLDNFAWCRPLMDPRDMEPIDYLHIEMMCKTPEARETLVRVLRRALRCSTEEAQACIDGMPAPFVRQSKVDEINRGQIAARAWFKRDFDAQKEAA